MNLIKSIQTHPAMHGVAGVVVAVAAFAGTMFAWGPDRPTYTMERPADHVTFNSITNNPNYGDEREFVTIKDVTTGGGLTNSADLVPGHEYQVQVYVHNNAASNLNAGGTGIAHDTTVRAALPASVNGSETVDGFVVASNAAPKEVYDTAALKSAGNVDLEYVNGSAMLRTNFQQTKLSDSVITTGVKVGDKDLSGDWRGCLEYAGAVTFNFKVKQPAANASFAMSKQVRKHSTTTGGWVESYAAQPGETVDYLINFKNDGQTTLSNVVVKDALPAGMTYVAGSTILANGNYPTGKTINDEVVTGTGINIGTYAPGLTAWVRFSATVAANDSLAACGVNTLKNVATVETDFGTKTDDAVVTVTKTCTETPVDKDVTVCEIATKKVVTIKESVYNANKSAYADKDSDLCKETPAPVDQEMVVCNVKTGIVETIKESVYNADKSNYVNKDSDQCKVKVCEISSKTVITTSKQQQTAHPELYEAADSATCKPAEVKTPATPTTAPELPKTGIELNALSLTGLGALSYAGYAYVVSRRS